MLFVFRQLSPKTTSYNHQTCLVWTHNLQLQLQQESGRKCFTSRKS